MASSASARASRSSKRAWVKSCMEKVDTRSAPGWSRAHPPSLPYGTCSRQSNRRRIQLYQTYFQRTFCVGPLGGSGRPPRKSSVTGSGAGSNVSLYRCKSSFQSPPRDVFLLARLFSASSSPTAASSSSSLYLERFDDAWAASPSTLQQSLNINSRVQSTIEIFAMDAPVGIRQQASIRRL